MKRILSLLITLTLASLLWSPLSLARIEAFDFTVPDGAVRYQSLSEELRCLVCQNQTLAGSNSELAQDLRRQVFELIESGKTDEEILDYMVKRYGDFVLYKPRMIASTAFLWLGPFVFMLIGIVVVFLFVRRRDKAVAEQLDELDEDAQKRAHSLLDGDLDSDKK